jgi:PIN domain nuclease of toxin-antitoxin system
MDRLSGHFHQVHTLDAGQVFDAGEITALGDPFDALICAAALDLSLPLITRDAAIVEARRVKTVW